MALPKRSAAALAALCAAPAAVGHQWFLQLVPNAEDYPQVLALGHQNKNGGGPLNLFGQDFRRHHFKWSLQLCLSDADGDGEPNGVELGDPCCTWREGEKPSRSYSLSHPGDPADRSGTLPAHVNSTELLRRARSVRSPSDLARLLTSHGVKCEASITADASDRDFWEFYYKDEPVPLPPATVGAVLSNLLGALAYPFLYPVSFASGLYGLASASAADFVRAVREGGLYKQGQNIFTLTVVACFAVTVRRGGLRDVAKASLKEKLTVFLLAAIWVEYISGLIHVVFDNPYFQKAPFIGAPARDFQWHHRKPTHICNQTWRKFLGAIDSGVILLFGATLVLRPEDRWMRMFVLLSFPMLYLMMASHRWSHTRPSQLPSVVSLLQNSGVLLSKEVHSKHHANYDVNFSLLTGWSNPVLNFCVQNVMGPKDTRWLCVFLVWALLPFLGRPLYVRYVNLAKVKNLKLTV
mmetsp:Transcript_26077/g.82493  ORF Transcript_26077/g.82493 Transcript_26077/m.82493 type:complete len:465 (-) Transcript_26077:42-1436(-)